MAASLEYVGFESLALQLPLSREIPPLGKHCQTRRRREKAIDTMLAHIHTTTG